MSRFIAALVVMFTVLACFPIVVKRLIFETDEQMNERLRLERLGKWNGI